MQVSKPPPETKRPPRLLATPCPYLQVLHTHHFYLFILTNCLPNCPQCQPAYFQTASIYGSPQSDLQKAREVSNQFQSIHFTCKPISKHLDSILTQDFLTQDFHSGWSGRCKRQQRSRKCGRPLLLLRWIQGGSSWTSSSCLSSNCPGREAGRGKLASKEPLKQLSPSFCSTSSCSPAPAL